MIDTTDILFARKLADRINEQIAEQANNLAKGLAKSFDDVQRRVGRIAGLREALTISSEIERRMMGLPPKEKS